MNSTKYICFLIILFCFKLYSQESYPPLDFLNLKENQIKNQSALIPLFKKLEKNEKVTILHIGDSHIQADYFTGPIRKNLQLYFKDSLANRGILCPYQAAKTNGPDDYSVKLSGNWDFSKLNGKTPDTLMGISGYKFHTNDSVFTIKVKLKPDSLPNYSFKHISLIGENFPTGIRLSAKSGEKNLLHSYALKKNSIEIFLGEYSESLEICLFNNNKDPFTFFGIKTGNGHGRLDYYSVGLNGASASTFLKSSSYLKEITNQSPDLLVVSLGTNDIFDPKLKIERRKEDFLKLTQILASNNCPVLLSCPPDHLRKLKYKNNSLPEFVNFINKLADNNVAVWDLYHVMGGDGSMDTWYKNKLAWKDKVHYTKQGYHLQAELFTSAFINAFENTVYGNN